MFQFIAILFCLFSCLNVSFGQDGICIAGDCKSGFGHFVWASGEEYSGNFEKEKMNGYGVFFWKNGERYIGFWKNGKMHGTGTLIEADGFAKKGIWKNNHLVELEKLPYIFDRYAIAFGKEQLNQLIIDRPAMATIVEEDDIIWEWVVPRLAGLDIGAKIYWQADSTASFQIPHSVNAVHAFPSNQSLARIWVRNTSHAEQMWASLIFELHNIRNTPDFNQIEDDAKHWRCDKETYIERFVQLEYKAAKATRQFYLDVWLPYCKSKNIKTNPIYWFYFLPNSYSEWRATFKNSDGYPWHPYAAYYDKLVRNVVKDY